MQPVQKHTFPSAVIDYKSGYVIVAADEAPPVGPSGTLLAAAAADFTYDRRWSFESRAFVAKGNFFAWRESSHRRRRMARLVADNGAER